jgi:DNA-binding NarL/FixJ family response regulator
MEPRHKIRLLIADDHNLVAEACKSFLEPEFEVAGIVNDGRALLRAVAEIRPDVVIVDIAMPLLNGLDAGEQVKGIAPSTKLIYLTMNMNPEVAAEAFRRGASGYLPKNTAAKELITAIREVLKGKSYLSPLITHDTVQFLLRSGKTFEAEKRLTPRQREVLQLIAEGMSMKEVAYTLNLKAGTVAFHKYRIMAILGVKTNAELLQYAIKHHMIAS